MHNRIVRTVTLAGFTAAAFAGLAVHGAAVAFGAAGGNAGDALDAGLSAGRGYSPGFSLVVLLTVAAAGVLSMTAYHLSHTRRDAARVRVRSAHSDRDLTGLRPDDRRRG